MKFVPKDYQLQMMEWLSDRDQAGLFCSPGLGKTGVTLWDINQKISDGASKGVLIIAPLRVIAITWPNEAAKWDHSSWLTVANMRTPEGQKAWEEGSADIYLINPEQLSSKDVSSKCRNCDMKRCTKCGGKGVTVKHHAGFVEKFIKGRKELPVDMIVFDEISLAKNPSSKRFNALRPFLDRFKYRIGLTGTPCPNSYLDLFAPVRLLDDGKRLGRVMSHFRDMNFESDYMGFKYTLRQGAKDRIDRKISDMCLVMLSEDYLDVPTCSTEDIEVTLPAAGLKAYKTMEKELLIELEKSDIVALNAATLTGKLLQIVGGAVYDDEKNVEVIHTAKIDALKALRKRHKTEPILVLTMFKHEMQRVLDAIPGSVRFDEKLMAKWQAGKIHTMVCQPQSMSHGIDGLQQGGRIACWFSLTWSNETYLQTNARIVRTGQSHETLIYRLLVRNTIDDAVAEALRTKSDTQSGLLNALKALQLLRKQQ